MSILGITVRHYLFASKGIVLLAFFLCTYSRISAQLNGIVTTEDNEPLTGVLISLHDISDSTTIFDFTTTDINGYWELNKYLPARSWILQMRFLGFKKRKIELSHIFPVNDTLKIQMKLDPVHLKEVQIKAERLALIQKGDTTIYNLSVFKTGNEKDLGDVLDALPGLDVQRDGQIDYNGKRIDQLLIEGKDILNNQHRLTTEGFKAQDIAGINIIQNYKDGRNQFSNKSSEKVAMNVLLTDEAKSVWKGNVQASAGSREKKQLDLNAFTINDKVSSTVFGRYNNTGETLLGMMDFISLQPSLTRILNNNVDNTANIVPEAFNIPSDLRTNNDKLIATNLDFDGQEKLKTKISLLATSIDRMSQNNFSRLYYRTKLQYKGEEYKRTTLPIVQANFNSNWKPTSNMRIEWDIPIFIQNLKTDLTNDGIFDKTPTSNLSNESNMSINIIPRIYFSHKYSDNWLIKSSIFMEYIKNDKEVLVSDINPLYATDLLTLTQWVNKKKVVSGTSSEIEYQSEEFSSGLGVKYHQTRTQQITSTGAKEDFLKGQTNLISNHYDLNSFLRYENNNWIIEPRLSLNLVSSNFLKQYKTVNYLNSNLLAKYSFNKLHFLLFKLSDRSDYYNLDDISNQLTINGVRVLQTGSASIEELMRRQKYQLSYLNYDLLRKSRFHSTLTYNAGKNLTYIEVLPKENHVLYQTSIIPEKKAISFRNSFTQRFSNAAILMEGMLNLNFSESTLSTRRIVTSRFIQGNVSIKTLNKSVLNAGVNFNYKTQSNRFGESSNQSSYTTFGPGAEIIVHNNKISFETDFSYQIVQLNTTPTGNILNLNSTFELDIDDKFTISIKGQDILNLTGIMNQSISYQTSFEEEQNFIRFPGYIMGGIEFKF